MRIVLDTNVLIAAALSPRGSPGRLVEAWLDGAFTLVTSDFQLDELARALSYTRLRARISPQEADVLHRNVRHLGRHVTPAAGVRVSVDPDDDMILATAVAGDADLIVSGDKPGMLAIGSIEGIPIVTPREGLDRVLDG